MSARRIVHGDDCACSACGRCDAAAKILADARNAAGLSVAKVAELAGGRSRAVIREMEDASDRGGRVHADVLLVPELLPHVADQIATLAGMVAVPLPKVDGTTNHLADALELQRETSEALTTHLHAIADNVITRAENAACRAEIMGAIKALLRVHVALEATADEPCTSVRRPGALQ